MRGLRLRLVACGLVLMAWKLGAAEPIAESTLKELQAGDPELVVETCNTLASTKLKDAAPLLAAAVKHPAPEVKFAALRGLSDLRATEHIAEAEEAFIAIAKTKAVRDVMGVWDGFGAAGAPALMAMAVGGKQGVTEEGIANPEALKIKPLKKEQTEDCDLRQMACEKLGRLQEPRAIPILLKVLRAADAMPPARLPPRQGSGGRGEYGTYPGGEGDGQKRAIIRTIIVSLGQIGSDDRQVRAALKKHRLDFSADVDEALGNIDAAK